MRRGVGAPPPGGGRREAGGASGRGRGIPPGAGGSPPAPPPRCSPAGGSPANTSPCSRRRRGRPGHPPGRSRRGGGSGWQFQDYAPPQARTIARLFERVSGYEAALVPYVSGFAGYKDYFLQDFRRPGYTIEVGRGVNPLPLEQFDEIYRANLGILTLAALVT